MTSVVPSKSVVAIKNVTVEYPESFPLQDDDKTLFDYRIKKMFRKGYVDIIKIQELGEMLGLDRFEDASKTKKALQSLHCDDFETVPPRVLQMIPALVGTYLGISVLPPTPKKSEPVNAHSIENPAITSRLLVPPSPRRTPGSGLIVGLSIVVILLVETGANRGLTEGTGF